MSSVLFDDLLTFSPRESPSPKSAAHDQSESTGQAPMRPFANMSSPDVPLATLQLEDQPSRSISVNTSTDSEQESSTDSEDEELLPGPTTPLNVRNHNSSDSVSTSTTMLASSPWVSNANETTPEVRKRKRKKKSEAKRAVTVAAQIAACDDQRAAELRAAVQENIAAHLHAQEEAAEVKAKCFNGILQTLEQHGYTWGDLVEWISRPSSKRATARWEGLFRNRKQVATILDLWAWKTSLDSRAQVKDWAVNFVGAIVSKEAQSVTAGNILQTRALELDDTFLRAFDLTRVYDQVRALCPSMTSVMRAFSTTERQRKAVAKRATGSNQDWECVIKQLERTDIVSHLHSRWHS